MDPTNDSVRTPPLVGTNLELASKKLFQLLISRNTIINIKDIFKIKRDDLIMIYEIVFNFLERMNKFKFLRKFYHFKQLVQIVFRQTLHNQLAQ